MITFVCWKWAQQGCVNSYNSHHVNVWASMVSRYYGKSECRIICVTDDPTDITTCETFPLWADHADVPNPHGNHRPSCYRRLKLFDGATTRSMGIPDGSKVVSIDLDVVMLKPISHLFVLETDFMGWMRVSTTKPIAYNGSMFMLRAGRMQDVWDTFDPSVSPGRASRAQYFGSDQGWISYVAKGRYPGWRKFNGIYSYSSDVLNKRLPQNAVIVSFNGKHKPWDSRVQRWSPWILKHWHL